MPFSPTFLVEIDKELSSLRNWREKIDERIQALEAVRKPLDFGEQASLPFLSVQQAGAQEASRPTPKFTPGPTLRATVLEALKQIGPSRAPQVANWLESQGFQNDSPTRLSTRIYNDLWRMTQTGMATVRGGVFSLTNGNAR